MIRSLHLRNLKCFEKLSLPLAPLTLLTGFNAAGKSSAVHGLLLLAQAIRQGGRSVRLPLNGPLVRLGTPGDLLGQTGGAEVGFGIESENSRIDWSFGPGEERTGHTLSITSIDWSYGQKLGQYSADSGSLIDSLTPQDAPNPVQALIKSLTNTLFISAVRAGTNEVYPSPEESDPIWADVGANGEHAAWWFATMSDEDVPEQRRHPSEPIPLLRKQFNAWAGELFRGADANAQRIPGTSLVRLELRSHLADEWRRPANIGYGFSYAFPILVAGLLARPGQILVVDSPEAHLHPMGQSHIGRFLAAIALSGVQVVVETHSDHVLNGVRLAVRDGILLPDHVRVHFFNQPPRNESDPAHVVAIRVDRNGNLSEWPHGFFDQAEMDLATLTGWGSLAIGTGDK